MTTPLKALIQERLRARAKYERFSDDGSDFGAFDEDLMPSASGSDACGGNAADGMFQRRGFLQQQPPRSMRSQHEMSMHMVADDNQHDYDGPRSAYRPPYSPQDAPVNYKSFPFPDRSVDANTSRWLYEFGAQARKNNADFDHHEPSSYTRNRAHSHDNNSSFQSGPSSSSCAPSEVDVRPARRRSSPSQLQDDYTRYSSRGNSNQADHGSIYELDSSYSRRSPPTPVSYGFRRPVDDTRCLPRPPPSTAPSQALASIANTSARDPVSLLPAELYIPFPKHTSAFPSPLDMDVINTADRRDVDNTQSNNVSSSSATRSHKRPLPPDARISPDSRTAAQAFVDKRQRRAAPCTPRTLATQRWLQSMDYRSDFGPSTIPSIASIRSNKSALDSYGSSSDAPIVVGGRAPPPPPPSSFPLGSHSSIY